jgi:hypothetical protein
LVALASVVDLRLLYLTAKADPVKVKITWTWTNWTFGVWWDTKKLKAGGIDLGPLEGVVQWGKRWKSKGAA